MAIKSFNPYSPSRRFITVSAFEEITTDKPYRPLVEKLGKHAGRNNTGKMTVRHQGGGHKKQYRIIDFKRTKDGIPAKVATIEYDPNRNARIALINYADGEKRYIIAPLDLKVGDIVVSGPDADIKTGNCLPLKNIPLGTTVHNVEMKIGKGGQMARSAGTSAQLMAKRATTLCSVFLLAKSVKYISTAVQPSVKLVTLMLKTSASVKLAAAVGWVSVLLTAALL